MSLYNKYRPDTLDQIKGNAEIISTLNDVLNDVENCPHTFLLHGETGCGKTTIARIIATRLGCQPVLNDNVINPDYQEVDTADFRGIDTVRDIRTNSKYMPLKSKVRVWVIDECHKLTNDAQNAFLKLLEDTPKHAYFILCTTEPNKLIETIKGRCSIYQVKPLSEAHMQALLRRIALKEGTTIEPEILEQIARDSFGLPRNAINILEQVLKSTAENRMNVAKQVAAKQSQSIELCRALMNKSAWKVVSNILKGLTDQDAEGIRRHILAYCQSVLLNNDNEHVGMIMEVFNAPLYNVGFPGLVFNCYRIIKS